MAFRVPSLEELHLEILADYANRFPGADTSRQSDNWKRTRILAGAVSSLHAYLADIDERVLPDQATGSYLARWGEILDLPKKAATAASGTAALRVRGTAASTVSIGDLLAHESSGLRFQVNEDATVPAGGTVDVDVLAIDTGSATRLQAGEVLVFQSPPAGIESEAELQADLATDGDDEETDDEYRARILNRIQQPGMGGNANDYVQWGLSLTGVTGVYVYPNRDGLGTVDIAALRTGEGSERVLSADDRAELLAYIDERRPVAMAGFRVLETTTQAQDVEVKVLPEDADAYQFDWNDETPLTVASWTAGTRTLELTTDAPDDLAIGDRIVIATSGATGEEVEVESLPAADELVLRTAPSATPLAGNLVYAGGPLVAPVREAILALLNSLGPTRGAYAGGTWEGSLRLSKLFRAAQLTPGVLDSEIVSPAATVEPTDSPPSEAIPVLIPGRILVRRLW